MNKKILAGLALSVAMAFNGMTVCAAPLAEPVPVSFEQIKAGTDFSTNSVKAEAKMFEDGLNVMTLGASQAADGKSVEITTLADPITNSTIQIKLYETVYGGFMKAEAVSGANSQTDYYKLTGEKSSTFLDDSESMFDDGDATSILDGLSTNDNESNENEFDFSNVQWFLVDASPEVNIYSATNGAQTASIAKNNLTNQVISIVGVDTTGDVGQMTIVPISSVVDFDISAATKTMSYEEANLTFAFSALALMQYAE